MKSCGFQYFSQFDNHQNIATVFVAMLVWALQLPEVWHIVVIGIVGRANAASVKYSKLFNMKVEFSASQLSYFQVIENFEVKICNDE